MKFSLPSVSIEPKQLEKIHKMAEQAFLMSMGCSRNMPLLVICGTPCCRGINMHSLATEQGALGTLTPLRLLNSEGRVPTMALIAPKWIQVKAGMEQSALEDARPLSCVAPGWMPSIPTFLNMTDGCTVNALPRGALCRHHDTLLMGIFQQCQMPAHIMAKSNRCRICFQVA